MRYGITENYDYNATHKRHRLDIWSGSFMSDHVGVAMSVKDGYMVTLNYRDAIRVVCPVPRDDSNYLEVDKAINDAINKALNQG